MTREKRIENLKGEKQLILSDISDIENRIQLHQDGIRTLERAKITLTNDIVNINAELVEEESRTGMF